MQLASGIELRAARRTNGRAVQILADAQLGPALAAQYRSLIEFSHKPNLGGMPRFHLVTIEAGIVRPAALEFHGDDVDFAAVVHAPRPSIYLNPSYRYP